MYFRENAVVFCLVFVYFNILLEFFLYIIFCIRIVIFSTFCFERPKLSKISNFLLETIKIIPTNQLMPCLICHFN